MQNAEDFLRISYRDFNGEASGVFAIVALVIVAIAIAWIYRPRRP